jgi:antitoxin ParD1/3/4
VVRAAVRAQQERDAAVDRWLRDEVIPVYDAMKVEPRRDIPTK